MTIYLPQGCKLNSPRGEYTIESVIGRGATAIAYVASFDNGNGLPSKRILKECYPSYMNITRTDTGELVCEPRQEKKFADIKARFEESGTTQNDVRSISDLTNLIPSILDRIHANNTVYLDVMNFEGETWGNKKYLSLVEKIRICLSVAKAVNRIHKSNYLCLDLKPSNILVLDTTSATDDVVHFIDFDSIRKKSDIGFGNSLSFTESWAAPEQKDPYGYSSISEATDIYTLGELVFWSVFGRHSKPNEHRAFSRYPFEEASLIESQLSRKTVQELLVGIFRNTLRSATSNRFPKTELLIELLEKLVVELQKKEYFRISLPEPNEFFIGRDYELSCLNNYLAQNKIAFLYGVGGIGKSEIAKQYIRNHKSEYNNIVYWRFSGDIEKMICDEIYTKIVNVDRLENQSDSSFCRYKLSKIRALLDDKTLIVIDNFDIKEADIEQMQIWEQICTLPGKLLITTKVRQLEHLLRIGEIESMDSLRKLFIYHYTDNKDVELDCIDTIDRVIEVLNRHTLLIELVAKQSREEYLSPEDVLEKLIKAGLSSFEHEYLGLKKDGQSYNATIQEHIKNVFRMSQMTEEQQSTLIKFAMMPPHGIDAVNFKKFYSLDNFNSINWLVDNGWLYRNEESNILTIHPIISKVAFEILKENDNLISAAIADSTQAIIAPRNKSVAEQNKVLFADAIAMSIMNEAIHSKEAGIYLLRYVEGYYQYGNRLLKTTMCECAINILQLNYPQQKYIALIERCYQRYASMLNALGKEEEAIKIAEEHVKKALANHDYYIIARWYLLLATFYTIETQKGFSYSFKVYKYMLKIDKDLKKKAPRYMNDEVLVAQLSYDYLADNKKKFAEYLFVSFAISMETADATPLYYLKGSKSALKRAIKIRGYIVKDQELRNTKNSIEIKFDEARLALLNYDYPKSLAIMQTIKELYDRELKAETYSHYRIHSYIGNIAMLINDYELAKDEFATCSVISKKLNRDNDYAARISLGRACNESQDIAMSEKVNTNLLDEVSSLDDEIKNDYLPDVVYNMACLMALKGDSREAINQLLSAIELFEKSTKDADWKCLGAARCYCRLADLCSHDQELLKIMRRRDGSEAHIIELYEMAKKYYELSLSKQHPEYLSCIEKMRSI